MLPAYQEGRLEVLGIDQMGAVVLGHARRIRRINLLG